MCGIAAIYAYGQAPPPETAELDRVSAAMSSRGPDGEGRWSSADGRLRLGHRRLSIIDLSALGAQPMASADGQVVISFNGEIYNYKALRRDLESRGYVFRTQADTEVLLHLYQDKGERMLHELRGMFALCLWDVRRQALLLARDPYGIKPLYYADNGSVLRVASQVKALAAGGGVDLSADSAGWVGFLLFGFVPEPHTIYRQVRSLAAGSYVWVDARGAGPVETYFSVSEAFRLAEISVPCRQRADWHEEVRDALLDSVRHHLVADVPVGAFLSAGVDSGSLVGLMRDAGQTGIQTITLTFDEFRNTRQDEAPVARQIAALYGTNHTNRVVTEKEFRDDLPRILAAMDQPTIDGINTWFVSKGAKEMGLKVAISGLGGDELFGGYSSFRDIPRCVNAMRLLSRVPFLGEAFRTVASAAAAVYPKLNPKSAGLVAYGGSYRGAYLLRRAVFMPWELRPMLDAEMIREGLARLSPLTGKAHDAEVAPATPFGKVASMEAGMYMRNQLLRDTDWASMAHSLEVRVPLVDTTLLAKLAPMLVGSGSVDRKALLGRSPSRPLPESLIGRRKTGFATPIQQWLERGGGPRSAGDPPVMESGDRWTRHWARQMLTALAP